MILFWDHRKLPSVGEPWTRQQSGSLRKGVQRSWRTPNPQSLFPIRGFSQFQARRFRHSRSGTSQRATAKQRSISIPTRDQRSNPSPTREIRRIKGLRGEISRTGIWRNQSGINRRSAVTKCGFQVPDAVLKGSIPLSRREEVLRTKRQQFSWLLRLLPGTLALLHPRPPSPLPAQAVVPAGG